MKRFLAILGGAALILLAAFFVGPRPQAEVEITFDPNSIPDDIDNWLAQSEARIGGITPGAEKEVIWADPASPAKTPIAVIYLHGFSATRHETRPLAELVAARLNANLFYTRLSGHGQDGEALAAASVKDWLNDTVEAIAVGRRIGEKVLIIGTSTGATLATWAMSGSPWTDSISGSVLISPNYAVQGATIGMLTMPWAETILPLAVGRTRSWEPANEEQGKWWTTSYPLTALIHMGALLELVEDIDKSRITNPALFVYSPDDQVIVPEAATEVAQNWGGPTKILEVTDTQAPSRHVIAGDILSPNTTQRIADEIVAWWEEL